MLGEYRRARCLRLHLAEFLHCCLYAILCIRESSSLEELLRTFACQFLRLLDHGVGFLLGDLREFSLLEL